MDYIITNPSQKTCIKLDDNGRPITCNANMAQKFTETKANNIVKCLPKTMKKFNFSVKKVQSGDRLTGANPTTISNIDYVPCENITRWVNKFGACSDILKEAEDRETELLNQLHVSDDEIVDILHIIEIEAPKDLFGAWKLYKRIRNNRRNRRKTKDELLIIENVLREVKGVSCLHREKVQAKIDGLFKRKYSFRVVEE